MSEERKPLKNPLYSVTYIPAFMNPSYNVNYALEQGTSTNFLIKTWGGLGDQVCAEPIIRYALNNFQKDGVSISLASECPELFTHLKFKKVYDLRKEKPDFSKYLVFNTIEPPTHFLWLYMSHLLTHCVDFSSICAFRLMLPIQDKEIRLKGSFSKRKASSIAIQVQELLSKDKKKLVFLHAGRHWPSKTFPKKWWDSVITKLIKCDKIPVLIGKDTDDNRGTVDVNTDSCLDLRNKLTIKELIYFLQKAYIVITNDSSPLHIAASGKAHIGFIASCKHPDYITHWRRGKWGWRMKNFSKDGIWNYTNNNPSREDTYEVGECSPELMAKILPDPSEIENWVRSL